MTLILRTPESHEKDEIGRKLYRIYSTKVLKPYQTKWILDQSRYKIACWARQTGKSFGEGFDGASEAAFKGIEQTFFAASWRQSLEMVRKARLHLEALQGALDRECATRKLKAPQLAKGKGSKTEIECSNGARIIALPANPDTTRGFTGHMHWDEAAVTARCTEFFTAVFPIATRGKLRVSITSTPLGDTGKFYEIFTDTERYKRWSRHRLTIEEAMAQGLVIDWDAIRESISDPDAIAQEYFCEFLSDAASYFPMDLLRSCIYDEAEEGPKSDGGTTYLGVDIGRHRHLTALCALQEVSGIHWHLPSDVMEKAPYQEQEDRINHTMEELNIRRCCIDATGIGGQLAEQLAMQHGCRVEQVTFTAPVKEDLATRMKRRLEQHKTWLPAGDQNLIRSLHAIRKFVTKANNIRFDAEESDKLGHADRAWGAMLAEMAAESKGEWRSTLADPDAFVQEAFREAQERARKEDEEQRKKTVEELKKQQEEAMKDALWGGLNIW